MCKISIIVATFNAEEYLFRALHSVMNLDFYDWECIIQDGLSNDKTLEIANYFSSIDGRFRIYSEKDTGIYDALNKAIGKSKGDWIYILGADDELIQDGLKYLLERSKDFDCVYGDVYIRDNNGKNVAFISKDYHVLHTAMCCSHQAIIMRSSLIKKLGGFDLQFKISADFELITRAFLSGAKFYQVHKFICYFSSTGTSSSFKFSDLKEQYNIFAKNKSCKFPALMVFVNFSKRFIRTYIYDPKR